MSKRLSWLVILALLAGAARAADEAAEPTAEALARAWMEQRFGGDAIEIWRTSWAGQDMAYGVARRWKSGRAEVLLRVLQPRRWEEMGFLMRQLPERGLQIVYYRSPEMFPAGRKAARVMPIAKPDLIERLPFVPGLPVIGTVYPAPLDELAFRHLPDEEVFGESCRVIEGRAKQPQETWDSFVALLSRKTGVSLDTQWRRRDRLVRRVTAAPQDVRDYGGGRFLPERIVVEVPGQSNQEFRMMQLMLDVALPDQLFKDVNLKTGRFPSY